jgi:hypothetical protein
MGKINGRFSLKLVMLSIPAILSFFLLGAHFYRVGNTVLAIVCLHGPILLFSKRRLLIRVAQGALFAGALVWLNTITTIYNVRVAMGQPWARMAIILFAVVLVSLVSIFLLEAKLPSTKEPRPPSQG